MQQCPSELLLLFPDLTNALAVGLGFALGRVGMALSAAVEDDPTVWRATYLGSSWHSRSLLVAALVADYVALGGAR